MFKKNQSIESRINCEKLTPLTPLPVDHYFVVVPNIPAESSLNPSKACIACPSARVSTAQGGPAKSGGSKVGWTPLLEKLKYMAILLNCGL